MSSAGLSNVGHGAFYSDGDQRTVPRSEQDTRSKFEEGQTQSHQNLDSSMSACQPPFVDKKLMNN